MTVGTLQLDVVLAGDNLFAGEIVVVDLPLVLVGADGDLHGRVCRRVIAAIARLVTTREGGWRGSKKRGGTIISCAQKNYLGGKYRHRAGFNQPQMTTFSSVVSCSSHSRRLCILQ